jgi:hypothetical protein
MIFCKSDDSMSTCRRELNPSVQFACLLELKPPASAWCAAMFDGALGLAPDWEKPAFCYAVYLDQLMVDAQRRQQALQQQLLAQQAAAHKVRRGATVRNQGPHAGARA